LQALFMTANVLHTVTAMTLRVTNTAIFIAASQCDGPAPRCSMTHVNAVQHERAMNAQWMPSAGWSKILRRTKRLVSSGAIVSQPLVDHRDSLVQHKNQ
jgi:hypothetical protein